MKSGLLQFIDLRYVTFQKKKHPVLLNLGQRQISVSKGILTIAFFNDTA